MDCVALGDQGAVYIGRRLGCEIHAAARRTAFDQASVMRNVATDHAIISLGDNKPCAGCKDPNLFADLWHIRSKVKARVVTWLLPRDLEAAVAVEEVAHAHMDRIILIKRK